MRDEKLKDETNRTCEIEEIMRDTQRREEREKAVDSSHDSSPEPQSSLTYNYLNALKRKTILKAGPDLITDRSRS